MFYYWFQWIDAIGIECSNNDIMLIPYISHDTELILTVCWQKTEHFLPVWLEEMQY